GGEKRSKMGKIVKYCNSCDEGFAEKFTFCPDCGHSLEAFEMNPVQAAAAAKAQPMPEAPVATESEPVVEAAPLVAAPIAAAMAGKELAEEVEAAPAEETAAVAEEPAIEASATEPEEELAAAEPESVEQEPEEDTVIRSRPPIFVQSKPINADAVPVSLEAE